jgi:hypothetical protein
VTVRTTWSPGAGASVVAVGPGLAPVAARLGEEPWTPIVVDHDDDTILVQIPSRSAAERRADKHGA